MSVRKLKENKITKDGGSWVFIQYSKDLDGEVNPHMTFKEAYTICYEYQKDKIKDSTLKTYGERIKYMGLLDNVELVNLD